MELLIPGLMFVAFLFILFVIAIGDGSIQADKCRCDYLGGACDRCMSEQDDL